MSDDELVEKVAIALCKEDEKFNGTPWSDLAESDVIETDRGWYRALARAALAVAEPVIRERERETVGSVIFVLTDALKGIVRDRQSNAQVGTGEYQRGYDDCIADHEERASEALKTAIRTGGTTT